MRSIILCYYTFLILIITTNSIVVAQSSVLVLTQTGGSSVTTTATRFMNDRSFVVGGKTNNGVVLGANNSDHIGGFVTRYDSLGGNLWIVPAGSASINDSNQLGVLNNRLPLLETDANNFIYVLGNFRDTCFISDTMIVESTLGDYTFLAKLDDMGEVIWVRKVTRDVLFNDMTIDRFGNIYMTGTFDTNIQIDSISLSNNGEDIIIAKFGNDGSSIWAEKAGGTTFPFFDERGFGVSTDSTGNLYVSGCIRSTDALFGNIHLSVANTLQATGFIAKYDTSGMALWVKRNGRIPYDIQTDPAGYSYSAGSCYLSTYMDTIQCSPYQFGGAVFGSVVGYVSKFDTNGNFDWVRFTNNTRNAGLYGIALDDQSNCYAVGAGEDSVTFKSATDSVIIVHPNCFSNNAHGFVVSIDSLGNPICGSGLNNCSQLSYAWTIDYNANTFVFGGRFKNTPPAITYNGQSLLNNGNLDGFAIVDGLCSVTTEVDHYTGVLAAINYFPNPFSQSITFKTDYNISIHYVEIIDIAGNIIYTTDKYDLYPIDLSLVSNGIYFYKLTDNNGTIYTGKIAKTK